MKNKKHPLFIFLKPMKKNLLMHCIANGINLQNLRIMDNFQN